MPSVVCCSLKLVSAVNAFSSSSSREWFSAESNELTLNRLELSSGDLERNDMRSRPQPNSVGSIRLYSSEVCGSLWRWTILMTPGTIGADTFFGTRFGGSGGGCMFLQRIEQETQNYKAINSWNLINKIQHHGSELIAIFLYAEYAMNVCGIVV